MTDWSMFFGFDVMGDLAFGKDFRMIENGTESEAIKGLHDFLAVFGILNHVPWVVKGLLPLLPKRQGVFWEFNKWCQSQVAEKQQVYFSSLFLWRDGELVYG